MSTSETGHTELMELDVVSTLVPIIRSNKTTLNSIVFSFCVFGMGIIPRPLFSDIMSHMFLSFDTPQRKEMTLHDNPGINDMTRGALFGMGIIPRPPFSDKMSHIFLSCDTTQRKEMVLHDDPDINNMTRGVLFGVMGIIPRPLFSDILFHIFLSFHVTDWPKLPCDHLVDYGFLVWMDPPEG